MKKLNRKPTLRARRMDLWLRMKNLQFVSPVDLIWFKLEREKIVAFSIEEKKDWAVLSQLERQLFGLSQATLMKLQRSG